MLANTTAKPNSHGATNRRYYRKFGKMGLCPSRDSLSARPRIEHPTLGPLRYQGGPAAGLREVGVVPKTL